MPTRTSSDLVGEIIEVDEGDNLDAFILTASSLVDRIAQRIADDPDNNPELSVEDGMPHEDRLELIERWLAAHFYAIRNPRTTEERAATVGETYQSKVDLGLNVTHYGQQAILLDTSGLLLAISKSKGSRRASATWLGEPYT